MIRGIYLKIFIWFTAAALLDPNRPDVRLRPDILEKWKQEVRSTSDLFRLDPELQSSQAS